MLKRLGDPEDGLIYSVKNITVGYASTTTQLPESSLILAFRNIRALETLTWSTWLPITSPILNCLHEAHPSARLVAIALERNDLPLDELLLSSPQLHTLVSSLSFIFTHRLALIGISLASSWGLSHPVLFGWSFSFLSVHTCLLDLIWSSPWRTGLT